MNVLFIYPLCKPAKAIYTGYHHGIGYLSALLKKRGHKTYLYASHEARPEDIANLLCSHNIDVVGVTSSSANFHLATSLIREVLRVRNLPVFVGGIHATLAPEEVAAIEGITGLCRGEAEEGFTRVVDSLAAGALVTDVPGFWFKKDSTWIKNPPGAPTSLEELPFPDRDIFDYSRILTAHAKIIGAEFLAGRGCPYSCTYCSLPSLRRLYTPYSFIRRRSVESLMAEIELVTTDYRVEMLGFHDDIFTLDKGWLVSFCSVYASRVRIPFWCNTRVGCITEEDARMLKEAGCVRVHMAIESGSERIREEVLNRRISNEAIIATFAFVRKAGLKTLAFNMIGLPFETEQTMLETIALNRRIRPDWIHLTMFRPFPGTPLYDICQQHGWIRNVADAHYYQDEPSLEQPQLPREMLLHYYRHFVKMVYG